MRFLHLSHTSSLTTFLYSIVLVFVYLQLGLSQTQIIFLSFFLALWESFMGSLLFKNEGN